MLQTLRVGAGQADQFLPCIQSAEEEDDQSHNALRVPPLNFPRSNSGAGRGSAGDETQKTWVTLTVCGNTFERLYYDK